MRVKYFIGMIGIFVLGLRRLDSIVVGTSMREALLNHQTLGIILGVIILESLLLWRSKTSSRRSGLINLTENFLLFCIYIILFLTVLSIIGTIFHLEIAKAYFAIGLIYTFILLIYYFLRSTTRVRRTGEWWACFVIPFIYPVLWWIKIKDEKI